MTFYEFLFGSGDQVLALGPLAIAGIASGVGSLFNAFSAGKRRREARKKQEEQERKIATLEANRQAIINPYDNVQDLSGMIDNPYENLQVATQAAEFQANEEDLSLAATLDYLRRTGASAGGATAIANAATRSKAGISANIEQQEVANQRLAAQGEMQQQTIQLAEKQRVQAAMSAGRQFQFGAQENREMQQLNRAAGFQEGYMAQGAAAQTQMDSAIGGLFGTASSMFAAGLLDSFKRPGQET